jgi:hypothetical protein
MKIELREVPMGPVVWTKDRSKNVMVKEVPMAPRVDVYADGAFVGGSVLKADVDAIVAPLEAKAKAQEEAEAAVKALAEKEAEAAVKALAEKGVEAMVVPPEGPEKSLGLPTGANATGK